MGEKFDALEERYKGPLKRQVSRYLRDEHKRRFDERLEYLAGRPGAPEEALAEYEKHIHQKHKVGSKPGRSPAD